MIIKINGKEETIVAKTTLSQLLNTKGLCFERLVVEHNFCILPKEVWATVTLEENDNLEIVSFVGGG
jgi:thiamine biosynthesis protein ThiS